MLAIIGGSGLARLSGLAGTRRLSVRNAYGEAALETGRMAGREVLFLARHGEGHSIAPHLINYRANIRALKDAGATGVAAVATVGGIRREFGPGSLVVPDQILDYTWGRASTFFDETGNVRHIDFTRPYAQRMRSLMLAAAKSCGEAIADGGTYAATQGPRLETAAEIRRLAHDGADLVGMTGMPEASLAREAGLDYAAIAVAANHAAGMGDSADAISLSAIETVVERAMIRVMRILEALAASYNQP